MKSTIIVKGSVRDKFRTEIECSHNLILDQPTAVGGRGDGPNPLELFLSSLAGCFCALGKIISNQRKLNIRAIDVKIEGDIDKDFLLGKTKEGRAGFTEIRSFLNIDGDLTETEKEEFINEIVRKCPVADNMINSTKLITNIVMTKAEEVIDFALA